MRMIINLKSSHERERKLLIFCLDVEDTDYDLLFPRPSSDVMIKLSIRAKEPGRPHNATLS